MRRKKRKKPARHTNAQLVADQARGEHEARDEFRRKRRRQGSTQRKNRMDCYPDLADAP